MGSKRKAASSKKSRKVTKKKDKTEYVSIAGKFLSLLSVFLHFMKEKFEL